MGECTESQCKIDQKGTTYWYRYGQLHREDGPAIEFKNGDVEYWIDGVQLTGVELFIKFGVVNG